MLVDKTILFCLFVLYSFCRVFTRRKSLVYTGGDAFVLVNLDCEQSLFFLSLSSETRDTRMTKKRNCSQSMSANMAVMVSDSNRLFETWLKLSTG